MATVTTDTNLKLISTLANLGTASATDLLFIQKSLKSYKLSYSDLVTGLPDGTTLEAASNKIKIKDGGVITSKILDNNVTFPKLQTISANSVIGSIAGGNASEIIIDTDISSTSASHDELASSKSIKDYVDTTVAASANYVAILQETQTNGLFSDGNATTQSGTWYTSYDSSNYTSSITSNRGTDTYRFLERNINNTAVNQNSIVESLTSKEFVLVDGTYNIRGWAYAHDYVAAFIRLKNDGTTILSSPLYDIVNDDGSPLTFSFVVTASGTTAQRTYSIEQGHIGYNQNDDFGYPYQPASQDEIYCQVEIIKLA